MRTIYVDFAPKPAWTRRALFGVIVLSWAFAFAASWHTWTEWRELKASENALRRSRALQSEQVLRERELQAELIKPRPYAKDAAEAVRIASFPTDLILHALEATQIEGVRVTSIDLNPDSAIARVELEFVEVEQLIKYLGRINEGEEHVRWELVQLKMLKTGGSANTGAASLSSVWR